MLNEFSDEWNEEELLESLFTLLTLLLSLLTILLTINSGFIRWSPFNLSPPCDVLVVLKCSQSFNSNNMNAVRWYDVNAVHWQSGL